MRNALPAYMAAIAAVAVPAAVLNAQAVDSSDKPAPRIFASIAEPSGTKEGASTPLWNRIKPIIVSAQQGRPEGFDALFKADAERIFRKAAVETPFSSKAMAAVGQSCLGPILHDEGTNWVQFSWVCRTGAPTPLTEFFTFEYSPELSATALFDGERIRAFWVDEPGMMFGARRLRMDAYDLMKADQK